MVQTRPTIVDQAHIDGFHADVMQQQTAEALANRKAASFKNASETTQAQVDAVETKKTATEIGLARAAELAKRFGLAIWNAHLPASNDTPANTVTSSEKPVRVAANTATTNHTSPQPIENMMSEVLRNAKIAKEIAQVGSTMVKDGVTHASDDLKKPSIAPTPITAAAVTHSKSEGQGHAPGR